MVCEEKEEEEMSCNAVRCGTVGGKGTDNTQEMTTPTLMRSLTNQIAGVVLQQEKE